MLEKPKKTYTWQEVAAHNTHKSAWIGIRGKVYDVTKFLYRHPGGVDTLLYSAGRDSTPNFETYHDLDSVNKVLEKYYIGDMVSQELPQFPKPNDFHRKLKKEVAHKLQVEGLDAKVSVSAWLKYFFIYTTVLGSYYMVFLKTYAANTLFIQLLFCGLLGFGCAQVGLHPLHDASHFAITHKPLVWKALGATHDIINGSSYLIWTYQHMVGHHSYTNIPGLDPDIYTSDPDFRRVTPQQKWFKKYLGQESVVPWLYGFLAWKTRLQDIYILYFEPHQARIRINPPTLYHTIIFWFGKLFFIFYRIILPLYWMPLWKVALFLIVSDLVSSYWLAFTFQVSHVVTTVNFPTHDNQMRMNVDWAQMQVGTTQDYAHGSAFWTELTGGLNYQTIHHVFPHINQNYYPLIAETFKKVCDQYKVPFLYRISFSDAFKDHLNHLKLMGLKPEQKKSNRH
ncbi:delta 5 fatty acid desaturase [Conidiobolus coronatus NRRL 28638]|uniref:Delta 5 fatty acid desaturase n=1 Tax=Conidiobolus coronatus (strain ATCC 28846 / CBS 209.66 / NRRL 28638) TaxID=796925 RepID=A0A137NYV8_CONC2|nr:delta 5 fatty acid desaturase [Conidiobolus coronatus NRRL 28638]|eukprot:KXN67834.1 delta 5 fatty acid desaturase [Conidiobolus coronatus NRRL 28638]